jgi:dTDP-4-dehydrorhamnose 3,5-epimerase
MMVGPDNRAFSYNHQSIERALMSILPLKVERTTLDGVLKVTPPTVYEDFRGFYVETYNRELYKASGIEVNFLQDDISVSHRHVLRGIHGDQNTWKLISCLSGQFYLVVINWDRQSPQYRKWEGFTLSEHNRIQVLIPPKFGNGHVVMTERAIFHYKQTTHYNRPEQFTIQWNDPELKIWWPVKNPILSQRDGG